MIDFSYKMTERPPLNPYMKSITSENESPAAGAEAPNKTTFIAKKTTAGVFALLLGGIHEF